MGFPTNPYGIMDMVFGLFIGSFNVLVVRGRDHDCFAFFFDFGVRAAGYANLYNKDWIGTTGDWMSVVWKLPFDSYAIYKTVNRCFSQKAWSEVVPWRNAFYEEIRLPKWEKIAEELRIKALAEKAAKEAEEKREKEACKDGKDSQDCKDYKEAIEAKEAKAAKDAIKPKNNKVDPELSATNITSPKSDEWGESEWEAFAPSDSDLMFPVVGHEATDDGWIYMFLNCIFIVLASAFTYTNYDSNYLYYNLGIQMSRLFGNILVLIDRAG